MKSLTCATIDVSVLSHVQVFVTLWTVAYQAPLCMGFSRQEYWSGLPFPTPGELSYLKMEPKSLISPALAGKFFTTNATGSATIDTIFENIMLSERSQSQKGHILLLYDCLYIKCPV